MERNERKANSRTHSITLDRDSTFILRKIILDFFILFCVGFLILVFYLWGYPYERGFFCDDESLKHPYKDSTITNVMLYIVGIGLPVFSMCLTEWLRLRDYKGGRSRAIFGKEVPAWAWEAYKVVGVFLFGCACQQLTTDIAKYTIGRLRPHFFDKVLRTLVLERAHIIEKKETTTNTNAAKKIAWEEVLSCFNAVNSIKRDMTQLLNQWKNMKNKAKKSEFSFRRATNMTGGGPPPPRPPPEDQELIDAIPQEFSIDSNCYDSDSIYIKKVCNPDIDCTLPENKWRYIEKFTCLNEDKKLIKEMRLSFPSGHSSFSAYTMFYFAIYLQKRFLWRGSKLFRHAIQFVLIMLAWYTVMSRVSDYKHHWSDVLAGFSIGLLFAILNYYFVSDLRKTSRSRQLLGHDNELHSTNGNTRGPGWSV